MRENENFARLKSKNLGNKTIGPSQMIIIQKDLKTHFARFISYYIFICYCVARHKIRSFSYDFCLALPIRLVYLLNDIKTNLQYELE